MYRSEDIVTYTIMLFLFTIRPKVRSAFVAQKITYTYYVNMCIVRLSMKCKYFKMNVVVRMRYLHEVLLSCQVLS